MADCRRVCRLNDDAERGGDYVLYWMQAAQRGEWNHALEFAVSEANRLGLPVLAVFGLTEKYPSANERHYWFMLEGLAEAQAELLKRGIRLVVKRAEPVDAVVEFAKKAAIVVTDAGHLRIQRKWREAAAERIECAFYEVETNLIVPVDEAADKENFSAGTFRPRIKRQFAEYLVPLKKVKLKKDSLGFDFKGFDISDVEKAIGKLKIDRSVGRAAGFVGGTSEAKKRLRHFIKYKLDDYPEKRNDPCEDNLSGMSPYLHFGQISPLYIALEIEKSGSAAGEVYLEEMIVRRELSHNFIYYNNDYYDDFEGLPPWAKRTLNYHSRDKREYVYSREQFEKALTHDEYWNAAQCQMVVSGKMHGYMRMYWGKKILEWSKSPAEGIKIAIYLNDKYELDGRDPNGYTGVLWCFGKHDRAWGEREVFGKIRYMNADGLKRKFDRDKYVEKVDRMCEKLKT